MVDLVKRLIDNAVRYVNRSLYLKTTKTIISDDIVTGEHKTT